MSFSSRSRSQDNESDNSIISKETTEVIPSKVSNKIDVGYGGFLDLPEVKSIMKDNIKILNSWDKETVAAYAYSNVYLLFNANDLWLNSNEILGKIINSDITQWKLKSLLEKYSKMDNESFSNAIEVLNTELKKMKKLDEDEEINAYVESSKEVMTNVNVALNKANEFLDENEKLIKKEIEGLNVDVVKMKIMDQILTYMLTNMNIEWSQYKLMANLSARIKQNLGLLISSQDRLHKVIVLNEESRLSLETTSNTFYEKLNVLTIENVSILKKNKKKEKEKVVEDEISEANDSQTSSSDILSWAIISMIMLAILWAALTSFFWTVETKQQELQATNVAVQNYKDGFDADGYWAHYDSVHGTDHSNLAKRWSEWSQKMSSAEWDSTVSNYWANYDAAHWTNHSDLTKRWAKESIAIDSAGNVYTANAASNNVTKTTPEWVSSTLGTNTTVKTAQTQSPEASAYWKEVNNK